MDDPKKLLQEANGFLRTAQNNMFSGKNTEAVELLIKAEEAGEKAKQQIPDDFQVSSLFQKIEKMRKDLEKKGISTRTGGNNELSFEVQSQLGRIRELLLRKDLEWAGRELNNYYSRFAGPMTEISEFMELKEQFAKLEADAKVQEMKNRAAKEAEAVEREKHETLCNDWEMKLKKIPYFEGTAQNVTQLITEKGAYKQAIEIMGVYQAVAFNAQKSFTLESLGRDIKQRIDRFPSQLAETVSCLAGVVVDEIEQRITQLNNDTAWKGDTLTLPYFVGKRDFDTIAQHIEELRPLFADNPQGMESINIALGTLHSINDQRKTERSKRIGMKPEAISGPEALEPAKSAVDAILKHNAGANVIKTAVVRPWEGKRSEGWYDNTKTNWVVRNLAETTVEVAALLSDGSCKLFSVHIEKELQPDGSYGSLNGNIMFEEMADRKNFETV
jgi:hypothetical protein